MDHYRSALIVSAAWLSLAPICAAAERDPNAILKAAIDKAIALSHRARSYTCAETVERRFFQATVPPKSLSCPVVMDQRDPRESRVLKLGSVDRLRVEALLSEDRELLSWIGASRFDEGGMESLALEGPLSTGAFGGLIGSLRRRPAHRGAGADGVFLPRAPRREPLCHQRPRGVDANGLFR